MLYVFATMPAQNKTLFAKWSLNEYTIVFQENGGSHVPDLVAPYTSEINAPTEPLKTGHSFDGWYSDAELTLSYSFDTMPLEGITLYAKWTINDYTISFDENGGSTVEDITEPYGTSLLEPSDPSRTGYLFDGWYVSEDWITIYVFATMPAENITLYAKWTEIQYTMTFVENDGSNVEDITASYGASISAPANPTKTGYTFDGWYSDLELTVAYVFTTMPINGITLYAKWTINEYTLTYYSVDEIDVALLSTANHSIIVSTSGRVYTVGYGTYGALGNNTTTSTTILQDITARFGFHPGETTTAVHATRYGTSFLLTSEGRVFSWGYNINGILANGTQSTGSTIPVDVTNRFALNANEIIESITIGYQSGFAITSDDRIFAWGYNGNAGLLFVNSQSPSIALTPIHVTASFGLASGETIVQIETGDSLSIALTSNGRVLTVGYGGCIGNGTSSSSYVAVDITSYIAFLSGETIVKVETGDAFAGALTSNGRIFVWGSNYYYQLGDETKTDRLTPIDTTPKFELNSGETIIDIRFNRKTGAAITNQGRVFTWGENDQYEIGDGTTTDRVGATNIDAYFKLYVGESIIAFGSQENASMIVKTSLGRWFGWGFNGYGALHSSMTSRTTPQHVVYAGESPILIETYDYNESLLLITPSRTGHTFGGWFQDSARTTAYVTTLMPSSNQIVYAKWTINNYTVVFDSNGGSAVTTWSYNYGTSIGQPASTKTGYTLEGWYENPELTMRYQFIEIEDRNLTLYAKWTANTYLIQYLPDQETTEIVSVDGGIRHGIALTTSHQVYTWASNNYGQVGNGTTTDQSTPLNITRFFGLVGAEHIVQVSAGDGHNIALSSTGRVFTWGYGIHGELGYGGTANRLTPTDITAQFKLSDDVITYVQAGVYNSFAISQNGQVFAFGYNSYAQIGDGTNVNRLKPVNITARFALEESEVITSISFSSMTAAAMTSNHRFFTWGAASSYGTLASGTTSVRYVPGLATQHFGLAVDETITLFTLGGLHGIAVTSAGRVLTWGYNNVGQLGDNSTTTRTLPVDITAAFGFASGESVVSVAASYDASQIVTSTGRVFVFGNNYYGQLGHRQSRAARSRRVDLAFRA
ncbi:MAG: InlB B-repeat-containing protein [Bacillus subtilis]|nr:InlB B-repeat-containing protein [Bacillus subtilis]